MNKQKNDKTKISKLAIVSFITGLLGILSFFLMFNWKYGEYLIAPTLLFAVISLTAGLVYVRRMKISMEKPFGKPKILLTGFGILLGACILLWFLVAIFTHY